MVEASSRFGGIYFNRSAVLEGLFNPLKYSVFQDISVIVTSITYCFLYLNIDLSSIQSLYALYTRALFSSFQLCAEKLPLDMLDTHPKYAILFFIHFHLCKWIMYITVRVFLAVIYMSDTCH